MDQNDEKPVTRQDSEEIVETILGQVITNIQQLDGNTEETEEENENSKENSAKIENEIQTSDEKSPTEEPKKIEGNIFLKF